MSMFVITDSIPQTTIERQAAVCDAAPSPSANDYSGKNAYVTVKIVLDFLFALTLLTLSAPVILIAMLLVKLTSRGPAIYSQTRLGLNGRPFTIYKIRTMTHNCESLTGAQWSQPGDSRVTTVGRWLRRTHIDELPQLWNVLCGDMSLIGPRPERPEFVPQLEQAIPHYRKRLNIRPGVTGLAQIQLPPDTDLDSVEIKLAYDLHYVKHMGLFYDLRIYAATFCKLIGMSFDGIRCLIGLPPRELIAAEHRAIESSKPVATVGS